MNLKKIKDNQSVDEYFASAQSEIDNTGMLKVSNGAIYKRAIRNDGPFRNQMVYVFVGDNGTVEVSSSLQHAFVDVKSFNV